MPTARSNANDRKFAEMKEELKRELLQEWESRLRKDLKTAQGQWMKSAEKILHQLVVGALSANGRTTSFPTQVTLGAPQNPILAFFGGISQGLSSTLRQQRSSDKQTITELARQLGKAQRNL